MSSARCLSSASSCCPHAFGGHLGPLAGECGQDGEVVHGVLGRDADDSHTAAGRDGDEPFVGQLEQGLPDGGATDPEFGRQLVEVEPVSRPEPAGEDAVAQLVGRLGPDGGADQFDI